MWDRIHGRISNSQKLITDLWLSFLTAGAGTTFVFILFDPDEILSCLDLSGLGRTGAYSIVFFFFWFMTSCASLLSMLFLDTDNTKNTNAGK